MLVPFLDLIFRTQDQEFQQYYAGGPQTLEFSIDSMLGNFNYELSKIIIESESLLDGKINALVFLCIIIIILFFFKNLFTYLALYVMAVVRNGILRDLRQNTYRKILFLPLSYYSEERKGDIISKLSNDVLEIEWSVLLGIELVFREPLSIILFLSTMIYMSPQLTVFVFLMLPLTALLIGKVGNSLRQTSNVSQSMAGKVVANLEETLTGLRIIKAFNAENKSKRKFEETNTEYFNVMVKLYRKRDLSSPLSEFLGVSILVIILWFGGKLVLDSGMSASVFIAFVMLFSQIITPAKALSKAWYNVQKGAASADRLGEIMNAEETISDVENPIELTEFRESIEYKNVRFSYRNANEEALKGINLTVNKGDTIALVGASGGGKSTLADLLPRFHDPTSGDILIDGISIRQLSIESLRNQMGIVTQTSILFNDTVFNNIAFGVEKATQEEVEQAARIANAHEFIANLPNGYETNIGDSGGKLSGGQKQRLSIARAVLKNPSILILDEATSALDTESEQLVQSALYNLMENRTSLVIAHRLSTIQHANRIVVIENGEVVESGSHDELLALEGTYFKLSQLQSFQ